MSRRHCATSSCRAAARLMIGMSDVLGTASPAGTGGGRAAGKQIVHTGSRSPAWRKATHSLAAKAKLQTLRLPGGLDGVEIGAARGIGLARRPGGPPGPLLAPDGKQAAKFAQRFGMIVDADVEIGKILGGRQQQRRRLLAATIAAGTLAGLQRRQQALGQGQILATAPTPERT